MRDDRDGVGHQMGADPARRQRRRGEGPERALGPQWSDGGVHERDCEDGQGQLDGRDQGHELHRL